MSADDRAVIANDDSAVRNLLMEQYQVPYTRIYEIMSARHLIRDDKRYIYC